MLAVIDGLPCSKRLIVKHVTRISTTVNHVCVGIVIQVNNGIV